MTLRAACSSALRIGAATTWLLASACDPDVTSVGAWDRSASAAAPEAGPEGGREPAVETALYLEAEDGELSGGFAIENDASASNGRAIVPPAGSAFDAEPGAARARYALQIPSDGEYVLWGRIYAPGADNNRFWFQLDGGRWIKWRISAGEIWYWDDLHDDDLYAMPLTFALDAGAHELVIANCVEGVRLDRLYFSAAGDAPPGNDTPCRPPHSIDIAGDCLPSCGSLAGTACGPVDCADRPLLPAYDCDVCCRIDP